MPLKARNSPSAVRISNPGRLPNRNRRPLFSGISASVAATTLATAGSPLSGGIKKRQTGYAIATRVVTNPVPRIVSRKARRPPLSPVPALCPTSASDMRPSRVRRVDGHSRRQSSSSLASRLPPLRNILRVLDLRHLSSAIGPGPHGIPSPSEPVGRAVTLRQGNCEGIGFLDRNGRRLTAPAGRSRPAGREPATRDRSSAARRCAHGRVGTGS